jgi:hypothetical protein
LTRRRYETVQLNAQLGTDGIIASNLVRPVNRISVVARTVVHVNIACRWRSTCVLLLVEETPPFQILVFTCRPTSAQLPLYRTGIPPMQTTTTVDEVHRSANGNRSASLWSKASRFTLPALSKIESKFAPTDAEVQCQKRGMKRNFRPVQRHQQLSFVVAKPCLHPQDRLVSSACLAPWTTRYSITRARIYGHAGGARMTGSET